ncbi:MAG TPA: hypothetical protein VED40_16660 [Azospirillaceae bacterium]|nr:hypothetical protein [Azospirillaceae bacterium]
MTTKPTLLATLLLGGALLASAVASAPAAAADDGARLFAEKEIAPWLKDPALIDGIKEQNRRNAALTQAEIEALDKRWTAELGQKDQPTIKAVATSSVSKLVMTKLEQAKGLYTEIIVMDAKGLNVGMTSATSDYWQGDEAKWKETFAKGPGAVHADAPRRDESTLMAQRQISLTVVDPADGKPIGAVTVAVDADKLELGSGLTATVAR